MLREDALVLTRNSLTEPTKYNLDVENRRRFPTSPDYDVLLSFVNPDPERTRLDRNLSKIAQDYLEPFVRELSLLANFKVKSQWLYVFGTIDDSKLVQRDDDLGKHFALSEDYLPQIITSKETKLGTAT